MKNRLFRVFSLYCKDHSFLRYNDGATSGGKTIESSRRKKHYAKRAQGIHYLYGIPSRTRNAIQNTMLYHTDMNTL